VHTDQTVVRPVEVEELIRLLNEGAGAVETVAPAVVLAGDTAGLLVRVVGSHQPVAEVAAQVERRAPRHQRRTDDDRRTCGK
jgi:hypothetical protein